MYYIKPEIEESKRAGQLDANDPDFAAAADDMLDPEFAMEVRDALEQLARINASFQNVSFVQRFMAERARQAETEDEQFIARREQEIAERVERELELSQTRKLGESKTATFTMLPVGSTITVDLQSSNNISRQNRGGDTDRLSRTSTFTWQDHVKKTRSGGSRRRREEQSWTGMIAEQRGAAADKSFYEIEKDKEKDKRAKAERGELVSSSR